MGSTTTNLGLYKPDVAEDGWGPLVDSNWDTIDTVLSAAAGGSLAATGTLAGATSVGDQTLTLARGLPNWVTSTRQLFLVIDPGGPTCEIRTPKTVSGVTISSLDALNYAHSSNTPVLAWAGNRIPAGFFGVKGDASTDDWAGVQAGLNECRFYGLWLDGAGLNRTVRMGQPIVQGSDARLRQMNFSPLATFAPVDAAGAAHMSCTRAPQTFTAAASNDTFMCPTTLSAPSNTQMVVFNAPQGQTLPGGIVSGRIYYFKTFPTSTTFTISDTPGGGGTTVDVTSDGSGWMYNTVYGLERPYIDDVQWDGTSVSGNLNGVMFGLQQPVEIRKLRVDHFKGTGLRLTGQQGEFWNTELVGNGKNLLLDANGSQMHFYGFNSEQATGPVANDINGLSHQFYGIHTEETTVSHAITTFKLTTARGIGFHGGYMTAVDQTNPFFELAGDTSSGFHDIDFVPLSGTHVIISDTNRAQTLTAAGLIGSNYVLGNLFQPTGSGNDSKWIFLDSLALHRYGATSIADGGTITHGAGITPTVVQCTPSVAGEMVSVTTIGATTFTVAIKKHDGTAGTTQTIYWRIAP